MYPPVHARKPHAGLQLSPLRPMLVRVHDHQPESPSLPHPLLPGQGRSVLHAPPADALRGLKRKCHRPLVVVALRKLRCDQTALPTQSKVELLNHTLPRKPLPLLCLCACWDESELRCLCSPLAGAVQPHANCCRPDRLHGSEQQQQQQQPSAREGVLGEQQRPEPCGA
eukprot:3932949-Rhodomonas_salina.1